MHDARDMLQCGRFHDARDMLQCGRFHDARHLRRHDTVRRMKQCEGWFHVQRVGYHKLPSNDVVHVTCKHDFNEHCFLVGNAIRFYICSLEISLLFQMVQKDTRNKNIRCM